MVSFATVSEALSRLSPVPGTVRHPGVDGAPLPRVTPEHPGRLAGFPLPQFQDRDFYRTVFFDAGEGDAIAFIHGMGGNLTHWQFVAPDLQKTHRVIGLDLPGFGFSERPKGRYTYDLMADAVFRLLDRRGVKRAVIAGHSFGGAVATLMALRAPERVRGLVLVNPAGYHRFPRWMQAGSQFALHPAVMTPALFLSASWIVSQVCRRDSPGVRAFRAASTRLKGGRRFLADLTHAAHSMRYDLMHRNFLERLRDLTMPVHLVWGEADRLLNAEHGAVAARALPAGRVTRLPGVGHMPIFEQPEAVVAACRDVFSRADAWSSALAPARSAQSDNDASPGAVAPAPLRVIR